jgi:hypothetical protein
MGHIRKKDGVCTWHYKFGSCFGSRKCLPLLVSWHECEFKIPHPCMLLVILEYHLFYVDDFMKYN